MVEWMGQNFDLSLVSRKFLAMRNIALYSVPATMHSQTGLFLYHSVSLLTLIWRLTQLKNLLQHLGLIRLLCVYLKDYCSVGAQCYMPYCALAKFSLACIKESAWVLKLNEQNRNGFANIFFD